MFTDEVEAIRYKRRFIHKVQAGIAMVKACELLHKELNMKTHEQHGRNILTNVTPYGSPIYNITIPKDRVHKLYQTIYCSPKHEHARSDVPCYEDLVR
jgi:hypothetical protein